MGFGMTDEIHDWVDDLEAEADDLADAADEALEAIAFQILAGSQLRTPVDTSHLLRTSTVEKVDDGRYKIKYPVDYAFYVHEREELHHDIGEARFLSKAINEAKADWPENFIRETEARL